MELLRRVVGVVAMVALVACTPMGEPKPQTGSPKRYAAGGLAFDYAGDWKLEEERETTDGVSVTMVSVESKGSGLAMMQLYAPAQGLDVDELLDLLTREMRKATGKALGITGAASFGRKDPATRTLLGAVRTGRRASLTVSALGQKVPHTFELYVVEHAGKTLVVFLQGADEDLPVIKPAFEQILATATLA